METPAHALLSQWENFWVIVGSSAGGLTGLMFVVVALIKESSLPRNPDSIDAFGTPTVIHFVAVLLLAAVLSALRRVRRQSGYKPVLEDRVWHLILPMIAYVELFVGAAGLSHDQPWALFVIGAVALLLLFIGIHNAWDTVAYVVATDKDRKS